MCHSQLVLLRCAKIEIGVSVVEPCNFTEEENVTCIVSQVHSLVYMCMSGLLLAVSLSRQRGIVCYRTCTGVYD